MTTTNKPVPLIEAIKRGETTIEKFDLRKPMAGDLRGLQIATLQMGDVNAIIKLVPRISLPRIEEHEVAAMGSEDIAEVGEIISGFFSTSAMRAYQTTLTN